MGPEKYGYWQMLALLLPYLGLLTCGVIQGAHLRLPVLRGGQREDECRAIKASATAVGLLSGCFALMILTVASLFLGHDPMMQRVVFTLAMSAPFILAYTTYGFFLRGDNRFHLLSAFSILTGVLQLGFIPVAAKFGLHGAFLAYIGYQFVLAAVLYFAYGSHVRPAFDKKLIQSLALSGLPIQLMAMADTLARTIDRYIVLIRLSVADFGVYAGAGMFAAPLSIVFASSSSVLYTQQGEAFGADPSGSSLRQVTSETMRRFTLTCAPLVTLLVLFLPEVTQLLIPKYHAGVLAIQCFVLGLGFSFVTQLGCGVLILFSRIRLLYLNLAVLIVINLALGSLLAPIGLIGVALAASVSFIVYGVMSLQQTCRFLFQHGHGTKQLWLETAGIYVLISACTVLFLEGLPARLHLHYLLAFKALAAALAVGMAALLSRKRLSGAPAV
jgi:O-antigen/teichoic acid export membrane protein